MSNASSAWKLSVIKQRFTLPEHFVFYMAKNPPSAELFNKLIQCCKYFWLKNPVITLHSLYHYEYDKYWRTYKINGFEKYQKLEIETVNEKLWIYHDLDVFDDRNQFLASSLTPKIYRCDLTRLSLGCQTVSFDEFQKFTSSGSLKWLYLKRVLVKINDGSILPIEKLIKHLPNLQIFDYTNVQTEEGLPSITSGTAAKLVAIPHFPQIERFIIEGIPESFDFEAFFATPKVKTFFDYLIN